MQCETAGACFQLVGFRGVGIGFTELLCGVPGISTLSQDGAPATLQSLQDRMALVLPKAALQGIAQAERPR